MIFKSPKLFSKSLISKITDLVRDEMKRAIEEEMGLVILKEVEVSVASSTEGDNSKGYIHYDIRIDPEIFRKLEESIQTITQGLGRLDVLLFRDSTPAVVNPKLKAQPVIENNDTDNKNIAEKPDTEKPKRKSRKKKVIEVEEDTPAVSKAPKFQLLDDDSDDDESDAWEEVHIEAENDHIEEVTKTLDDSDINNEEERNVPKSGGDDSDEYLSDSDEDAIGMVKSKVSDLKYSLFINLFPILNDRARQRKRRTKKSRMQQMLMLRKVSKVLRYLEIQAKPQA